MWQLVDSAHPVLTYEGGAILDERTGRWTHLTSTASAAVMLLLAGNTREEAAGQYAERYGIETRQADADVRTVVDALTAQGLATTGSAARRRRWGWWR
ncbi:PqqD family peptide modification chaperone [Streptomyces sp. NPDC088252]|uniref:PqqD family peptide modification chaperone n=1 Tax=unclassified Streptomyces TaxID=2593676 RepID=UPI003803649F